MAHYCKALVLHCIDFRLGPAIKKYLEEKGLLGNCDIVSVAGAVKDLVSPKDENDRDFVLRQVAVSKRLHNVKEIILINHTDCGAYGGRGAFGSEEEERNRHIEDMQSAGESIKKFYPDLAIKSVLAEIKPTNEVHIEEIR